MKFKGSVKSTAAEITSDGELVQITNTGSPDGEAGHHRDVGRVQGWHNDISRAVMPSCTQLGHRVFPVNIRL